MNDEVKVELIDDGTDKERAEVKVEPKVHDPIQNYIPLAKFLNVDDIYSQGNLEKLEAVDKFLSDKATTGTKLKALSIIERKLNQPRIGETRLDKVYNFVRAQEVLEEARETRDAYLG